MEMLRSLISAIVLTPYDTGLAIDLQGDLAGILAIATAENAKSPGAFASGTSQLKMVAGTRFHLNLRRNAPATVSKAMDIIRHGFSALVMVVA